MNDQENEKFAQQLKSTLDKSVSDLDENVRCKLQIARGEILNKEINSWRRPSIIWASTASVLVISVLVLMLVSSPYMQINENEIMASVESNIFEDDANIEFYEELDFYVWLSEQETNT